MTGARPYQVYVYSGQRPQVVPDARLVDITPPLATTASMIDTISAAGLTSADLRSRVVFVIDADSAGEQAHKDILAYVSMLGLSRRRLDVAFGFDTAPVIMSDLDAFARQMADAGKPADPPAAVHVSADPCADPDCPADHVRLSSRLAPGDVTSVRYARKVTMTTPPVSAQALPQFLAISSIRARGETERLPGLAGSDGTIDTEPVRRAAESLRRTLRGDDRSAIAPRLEQSPEQAALIAASRVDIVAVLEHLGARSRTVDVIRKDEQGNPTGEVTPTTTWHCLHPEQHTNGDASPSARVTRTDRGSYFQCFRCLPEKVDPVRLVVWVTGCTPIEAAEWIGANVR